MPIGYNIRNKIALVTGANRGIGKKITETFLQKGAAKVYAAVRNTDTVMPLIEKYGKRIEAISINLEKLETIIAASHQAKDVEVVVNNAGVNTRSMPLNNNAVDSLNYELEINVNGLIRMAQSFSPVLKKNGGGVFIQINSVASMKNFVPIATYCASKAAAYSITQSLREILNEQGTFVMSVHPGPIATDMIANVPDILKIAESPQVVADSIIDGLNNRDFHVFPDKMAKEIKEAYQSFSENIIEGNILDE
ncbi:MAG: short-chain dehydrogenase [Nitrosomonadaceae bacterium]|nr:short-chain dehydrogenase [Nitrosomonadaceae bacterium]|tara:strand:+ start:220 stop:972 length:753 start_codon:yes stop_codon:yes gene_type:complete